MSLKSFHYFFFTCLISASSLAQSVFTDDIQIPSPIDHISDFSKKSNFELFPKLKSPPLSDSFLAPFLKERLIALTTIAPQKCQERDSYLYALSLTMKGNYDACVNYVDSCLKRSPNIPVATIIQGARCAKTQYNFSKAYEFFDTGRRSEDFKSEEKASALLLEFALFAQYSIYADKTDEIINFHPSWTQDERDSIKSLIQFLGKASPVKKTKEQVFQFVDDQIKISHDFLARLLKTYRINLYLNEYRYETAYDYLLQDVRSQVNPLDWWYQSFQILYSLADDADFTKPIAIYRAFLDFANVRSNLPTEQNVYNYTQIYKTICKDKMLQGKDHSNLQSDLRAWKKGQLPLVELIQKIENNNITQSDKSDLLSTYAGLLVINNDKDKAREYYWKSHLACPFNNRSHWGLVLIHRKNLYAAYPEFEANIQKMRTAVSQINFPPEIENYFLNWKALPAISQERIKYGARIWAPFMKELSQSNYKVYIKSPFELLSMAPGYESIRDTRIGPPNMPTYKFDNRLWDDVRGAGGRFVIADHDESFETVQGDYNLLGHEITHQFHAYLSMRHPQLSNCIENLYANSVKNKSFPDPYAASNSKEYFAQGVTYFLIPEDAPARYGINSSWYPKNDPKLYDFILSIQNSDGRFENIKCSLN